MSYDDGLRLGISWMDDPLPDAPASIAETAALNRAVAGIVSIAAERARLAGDLNALREAVERALAPPLAQPTDETEDPREAALPQPPAIRDADLRTEAERLNALRRRQGGG